ncbi:vacuolar assembly protein-like protein [Corynespora cassiicola Philippines]|uniref:Vacuolar assembly protein-like protein n=1 Tax=Corynespora cassiicola Philippines TaxID=1448308 RepID=A0A2T2N4I2_CORCC|nr:vacuolar assembly protein-like protein [Corynespora cassiicola Philippines]
MAADSTEDAATAAARDEALRQRAAATAAAAAAASNGKDGVDHDSSSGDDNDNDEEGDDEPKLKYTRLTGSLGPVYRNGDATSTFIVAGDKMIVGTHNGNIHVLTIPSFQPLRNYNAHPSASVTALSVSPFPPPQPLTQNISPTRSIDQSDASSRLAPTSGGHSSSPRAPRQPPVPATPANQIYIASSSIDGHVCVSSLVDPKDVTLRNFARPVQAVALSPEYKSDRSYLSGGLAGELILTTGGQSGVRSNANTSQAAAAAQGWLGAIGLGGNSGRDLVLHSGEGIISSIKWSLSGKYVAWANEHGIRIMRTNIHLESADSDSAWKRIGFIDKPNRRAWQDMAGVWKARIEWVDDDSLESDDDAIISMNGHHPAEKPDTTLPHQRSDKPSKATKKKKVEKLVIGWGDAAWVVHVSPGGAGVGKDIGERSVGSAEIIHFLRFDDCIVSGISLYTPSLLLVLAYRTRDDDDNPINDPETTPKRGIHRRTNGLSPELKLIDAATSDEVEVDSLTVSRFESLSAADYHLSTLYVPHPKTMTPAQKSAFEAIGGGIWDAGVSAARIFSSGASVVSMPSSGDLRAPSVSSGGTGANTSSFPGKRHLQVHPNAASAGLKVFIQSPYDCVLAIKRELTDHFNWELEHENYKDAWELLDDHPEIITSVSQLPSEASPISTPKRQGSLQEFFADENESQTTISAVRTNLNSSVEKEKRRIGDLWVQQLVNAGDWKQAGKVAGRVLGTSTRWEHWVWKFAQSNKFNEIAPHIPTKQMQPPLPSLVYEVVLGHYIIHDRIRFKHLLEDWEPELFDITSVIEAIKSKLTAGDVTEDSIEGGEQGRDWRILQDGLAKLYLANGQQREALRCYIRLQNADAAMSLIREFHLVEAVRDDVPGFILMRISKEQHESQIQSDLEEASSEAINVLVDEACRGTVPADDVVSQLRKKGKPFEPYLFFYLRSLWKPETHERKAKTAKERVAADRLAADGKIVAEEFADLMVELFARYDRPLLMEYLKKSQSYDLGKATSICEDKEYIPELVHILSKTGQTKRALYLIIEKLSDVSFAISFAKEQDDPDLWNDLLEYSMDKPHFIRGLLEEVGTAIDPIQLVRRIPEGLEIEGLRDGIGRMVREYEIQHSISEGVAKVLRSEVAGGMDMLRAGQKRGVKFEVIPCDDDSDVLSLNLTGLQVDQGKKKFDLEPKGVDSLMAAKLNREDTATTVATSTVPGLQTDPTPSELPQGEARPGHCTGCHRPFTLPTAEEEEIINAPIPLSRDTLVGFACGHVFHLSCLLPKTSASASVAATLQQELANDALESGGRWSRSVGAKVAHAHIIKRAVGRGCVVCRERERMLSEEE